MKKITAILLLCLLLNGCTAQTETADIAATTLPVYEFTTRLVYGTGLSVTRLVTEAVSCLHDYSLDVRQVKAVEAADTIILSGAGLEEFMDDILTGHDTIDASAGIPLLESATEHDHEHESTHHHEHEQDPHIWLSPQNAILMAQNICDGLCEKYPEYTNRFESNLDDLCKDLVALRTYGEETLSSLSAHEIITFHDGFGYFADAYGLTILEAVEEESGSEASAKELIHLIEVVRENHITAIFTEENASASAADVISRETGANVYVLDMAMSGDSYFDSMYHNIDTIKEALG